METNFANDESNDNFLSTFINMHLTENIRFYVILLLVNGVSSCSISQTASQGQSLCRKLNNHVLRQSRTPFWLGGVAKFGLQLFKLFVIFPTTSLICQNTLTQCI